MCMIDYVTCSMGKNVSLNSSDTNNFYLPDLIDMNGPIGGGLGDVCKAVD